MRILIFLGVTILLSLIAHATAQCARIESFLLPSPPIYSDAAEGMAQVGQSGDPWLILPMPLRLIRLSDADFECVYDSAIMTEWPMHLTCAPDGRLWIGYFEYVYSSDIGLHPSGIDIPSYYMAAGSYISIADPMIDADGRLFLRGISSSWGVQSTSIWELIPRGNPISVFEIYHLDRPFLVSANEMWAEAALFRPDPSELTEIDLNASEIKGVYAAAPSQIDAKDAEGVFWSARWSGIYTFDRSQTALYCSPGDETAYKSPLALTANGTIWVANRAPIGKQGIVRIQGDNIQLFTESDGLFTSCCSWPLIDYDGQVWVFSEASEGIVAINCISDGGWPPMRLMLRELATEGTIAVEAQVINNGPVVGVDVYIALELGGQLLYWPNWTSEPHANQVNLRPGHNQTATIIEMSRDQIPPGSYTVWGCMTGRNTQKLIGPIDRKFESVSVVR
ncbi:MAG: hypothetical protein JW941_10505 [Candidatus Coatesbacteria bacterium]|nr:hypothetical protein [Candidatus Coatesbacteria bacterium]